MKKLMIFFLLISLSATSQTKRVLYLDQYVILAPSLYQHIKDNVIEKLTDKDVCSITGCEPKKGTLGTFVCISAIEQGEYTNYEMIPRGYLLISDHMFLVYNPQHIPGLFNVGVPTIKYEQEKSKVLPQFDGGKEWWFFYADNNYYLIDERLYW